MASSITNAYQTRQDLADQYKTQQTEKDDLATAHQAELDNLKKSYANEKASMEDRFESSVQAEKGAHYDHLRNLKSQMNREERNLQTTKNQVIDKTTSDLKHEEIAAEQDGRSRVKNAIEKYSAAEEFERNKAQAAETEVRTNHKKNAEHIISDSQKRLNNLAEEKATYLDQQKQTHVAALDQVKGHYQEARTQAEDQFHTESSALINRATADLNTKRLATASFMQSFNDKHQDPFYQLKRFDSDLLDVGDAYILRVKVPEYERKQFKVQVSGQEIQLMGVRSSDEEVQLEPGRKVATRSYQNVSERYALSNPVDGRTMSFKEEGEWLEYTIPKFGPNHHVSDAYRRPENIAEDLHIAKELNFVNTLPVPHDLKKGGNETMS